MSRRRLEQFLIATPVPFILGILACIWQSGVVHTVFVNGHIPYGFFATPQGQEKRFWVIEFPMSVVAGVFVVYGVVATIVLWKLGHRRELIVMWLFLFVCFVPFAIYNFVLAAQGDASIFI
jgi:hypothetical protein